MRCTYKLLAGFGILGSALGFLAETGKANAETRAVEEWRVTCNQESCAAHYDAQGVQIVVAVPADGGSRRILLRLDPKATVGQPVGIRLNGGWSAGLAVSSCSDALCQAAVSVKAGPEVEQAFKRAREGVVAYQAGSAMVIAPISLVGFTQALAQVGD
ncbi:MAG: invasion associated locus B family protein [Tistlia sp.]|uniref:invasion associated locus B family protein n=1 Tax=Tistlia sp. TaxID=3057121 RepID=UPI0034A4967F